MTWSKGDSIILAMTTEQCIANIKPTVSDIIGRLERGEFQNEAAVSTGVVARLLSALGWEIFNPAVVSPQYSTESGRVDYALCHPPKKPYIFVEVKAVGKARDGESQAFRYAFDEGVAILVVTDGKEWFLYLPTGQGKHSDRQFYTLDLLERPLDVCVNTFCRFLNFDMVASGKALDEARKTHRDKTKEDEIRRTMPEAWNKLLSEADEELQVLLSEQVQTMCGHAPNIEAVENFLRERAEEKPPHRDTSPPSSPRPESVAPPVDGATVTLLYSGEKIIGFRIANPAGEASHTPGNAKRTLEKLLKELQQRDSGFLPRLAAHPQTRGRQGALFVAPRRDDLNRRSPHVAEEHGVDLKNGWWMGGPYSQPRVITLMKMSCKVAGVRLIER